MRVRTSITLPKELLIKVDALAGKNKRSEIVETALRDFLQKKARAERDKRELEIINANAGKLNEEALDVLEYQQIDW